MGKKKRDLNPVKEDLWQDFELKKETRGHPPELVVCNAKAQKEREKRSHLYHQA